MSVPFSERFGDVYFSRENGLAETRHVFLKGNGLPEAWAGRRRFTILETGFGTGLNFLAAWTLFEETAAPDAVLDYVAVELYPMEAAQITEALSHWADEWGGRLERMVEAWPMRVPGYHRLHFGRVRLTLIFDDVNDALPGIIAPIGIDAWFLDGFAPAKNPQMWSDTLYRGMARLSAAGASAASFTAAGAVRRGLQAAGFSVEKATGYGRKRDMTVARWPGNRQESIPGIRKVAVIGGGLAGTACAFALKRRGFSPVIFERGETLASAASGNRIGLCNPRFSAQRHAPSDFYTAAYALAHRTLAAMDSIAFDDRGSLHLVNTAEREKRFAAMIDHWHWPEQHMHWVDAGAASDIAGTHVDVPCLHLPQSMSVDPAGLCRTYAENVDVDLARRIDLNHAGGRRWFAGGDDFDAMILAHGTALIDNFPGLHSVRGQVSWARPSENAPHLKSNLCYGGYISAARHDGMHMIGSTFQKWLHDTDVRVKDDADNLAKLEASVPSLRGFYKIENSRAALRVASRDHFPVCGSARGQNNVFVSGAHGSHGIISSLACAELLADMIDRSPYSLGHASVQALDPNRFPALA